MRQDNIPDRNALWIKARQVLKCLEDNNFGEGWSIASVIRRDGRRLGISLYVVVMILVIFILAAYLVSGTEGPKEASPTGPRADGDNKKYPLDFSLEVFTSVVAIIGIFFAYIQWRRDKRSASYDSYYSRLDIANQRFDAWKRCSREKRQSALECRFDDVQAHCYNMFIFAELDNLEYAIGKYKRGFIDDELASRAVMHFLLRCEHHKFRNAAAARAIDGAYMDYTKIAQEKCCDRMSKSVKAQHSSNRP